MSAHDIDQRLRSLHPADPDYAAKFVDALLAASRERRASDLHLLPTPDGLAIRWRLDGVLHDVGVYPPGEQAKVITRLKVLAELLTYRADVPQEGRLRETGSGCEVRVSTLPTIHGEKAVVRLFAARRELERLDQMELPADILAALGGLLNATSGAILVSGPAGSGKTTLLYGCAREIVRATPGRNVVTLEDPVEIDVPGVTQSQINVAAGFDLLTGLRSLVRQDPEVIMIGEIRDRITADVALQASLTGQLVMSSFHAGSAAGALSRLLDMGIEPYVLQSGLLAVLSLRLVRRLCRCARAAAGDELCGLPVTQAKTAVGCERCFGSGYAGRALLAEYLPIHDGRMRAGILQRADAGALSELAVAGGMLPLRRRGILAVEAGVTSPLEVLRVLGSGQELPW